MPVASEFVDGAASMRVHIDGVQAVCLQGQIEPGNGRRAFVEDRDEREIKHDGLKVPIFTETREGPREVPGWARRTPIAGD